MKDLKITIEQLKNYLGTGCFVTDRIHPNKWSRAIVPEDWYYFDNEDFKSSLICYRLSDLDKFIPELGFVPVERIRILTDANHFKYIERFIYDHNDGSYSLLPFWVIELLFQWHFWPFGNEYFDQGLVIDKLGTAEK